MKRQLQLFSKVGSAKNKAVKAKVGDPVYNAYKKAPLAVKKIIDTLEPEDSYNNLGRAAKKLRKLGWDIDYYLDGSITRLYKMKKPAKKVGAKAKAKKAPARSMHKDTKSHNVNIRVVSGINNKYLDDLNKWVKLLNSYQSDLILWKEKLKLARKNKNFADIKNSTGYVNLFTKEIKDIKKHITGLKKHIK